ncbi:MAG: 3-oxoacyl-ACP reductase FabG [Bdellovibrionales bacterium]|nr:3-oxoacyl-ACP reductase FabG [Bdellovibrionales bacterium]
MVANSFNLKDQAILVTGASRGIGASIATRLGECGAWVGVTYTGASEKSQAAAQEVCGKVESAGGRALALAVDVANEEQVAATVDAFVKHFGKMNGLVNNAGVAIDQLVMRYKTSDWDRLMNVNLRGAFLMSKAALRPMMKAGGGSIVNMSSVVGQMGNAGQVPYCTSKAGLLGMTMALAREVGSRQIRVNAIAPGFIETDMTDSLTEDQKNALTKGIPLECLGQPDDIASGTLYLLSPLSRYVTGQVLNINGGLYM